MPLDPTCGRFVRDGERALRVAIQGHAYHFCSRACLRRFTAPERELAWLRRSAGLALGAGALLLALGHLRLLEEPLLGLVLLGLGTLVQVVAGWPFYAGLRDAARARRPNMDVLVALGTTAAWLFGSVEALAPELLVPGRQLYYFEVSALVLGFVAAGRSLEQRLRGDATHEVRRLLELQPSSARVLRGGVEVEVPLDHLAPEDVIVVGRDQAIPADGVVVAGEGAVDEKLLTGEALPVDKRPGDRVIGGSVNRGGVLHVQAQHVGGSTALAKILALIGEARAGSGRFQRMADRLSAWFVPLVVALALATLAGWMFVAHSGLPVAFSASVAVLLIACPAALGLAAPAVLVVGVNRGARQGMLLKDAEVLERIQKVDIVVFDKTGTLTRGEPALTDVAPGSLDEASLLSLAASAEYGSEHPLGRAVVRTARERGLPVEAPERARAMAGVGVVASVQGAEVLVGSPRLFAERRIDLGPARDTLRRLLEEGKTVVLVGRDDELAGMLAFSDPVKPEAAEAVRRIQAMGIEVCLVTGDHARTAQAVARQLGIRRSFAEITPQGKAAVVRGLQEGGKVVAMAGDGINDAPALAAADVGVAIGAGAEVAVEAADFVLMKNDPRQIADAIELGQRTITKVRQNLAWAFSYNAVLLPVAALGLLNPLVAGLAMAFSALPVVGNAVRLARTWDRPVAAAVQKAGATAQRGRAG